MSDDRLEQQYREELEELRRYAATTTDGCSVAKSIAASDARVQALLLRKVARGDVFRGMRCLGPESVLFALECPPGVICLAPRSFLVRVSLAARHVAEIVDPFDPTEGHAEWAAPTPVGPLATPLAAAAPPSGAMAAGAMAAGGAVVAGAVAAGGTTIAVKITNVTDRAIQVDGQEVPFPPFGDTATAIVSPGKHRLSWQVQAPPGVAFTLTLDGVAGGPLSLSGTVSSAQREAGFFFFTT